jgi:hypothetical protein
MNMATSLILAEKALLAVMTWVGLNLQVLCLDVIQQDSVVVVLVLGGVGHLAHDTGLLAGLGVIVDPPVEFFPSFLLGGLKIRRC